MHPPLKHHCLATLTANANEVAIVCRITSGEKESLVALSHMRQNLRPSYPDSSRPSSSRPDKGVGSLGLGQQPRLSIAPLSQSIADDPDLDGLLGIIASIRPNAARISGAIRMFA